MTTARIVRPRIPVTVIGGFLGAGKTSLLNHLLAQEPIRRTSVMVNDFGSINIDRALIAVQGTDAIELTNGCVCCQIGDDLTDALIAVIESDSPPEAIVIEASGVSDPWRIAQVALADPALTLEGVLVLLDAAAFPTHAADPLLADTVMRQLEGADLLVVNKTDQASDEERTCLHAWLQDRLPSTPRIEAVNGRVPVELLGVSLMTRSPPWTCPHCAGTGARRLACAHPADHGSMFGTWSLENAPIFSAAVLRRLLKAMPAGVLRLKGLVRTDEHALAEIQFAGRHGSLRLARSADVSEVGTVVAIGYRDRMPDRELSQAFMQAAVRHRPDEVTA